MSNHKPIKPIGFKREVKEPEIRKVDNPGWNRPTWRWYEIRQYRGKYQKVNESMWERIRSVYKYAITKLFLAIVSFFVNPKLSFFFMISWLKQRLAEPSTYRGIIGFATALGITLNPEMIKEVIALSVAVLSFVEFVRKEKDKTEKE